MTADRANLQADDVKQGTVYGRKRNGRSGVSAQGSRKKTNRETPNVIPSFTAGSDNQMPDFTVDLEEWWAPR